MSNRPQDPLCHICQVRHEPGSQAYADHNFGRMNTATHTEQFSELQLPDLDDDCDDEDPVRDSVEDARYTPTIPTPEITVAPKVFEDAVVDFANMNWDFDKGVILPYERLDKNGRAELRTVSHLIAPAPDRSRRSLTYAYVNELCSALHTCSEGLDQCPEYQTDCCGRTMHGCEVISSHGPDETIRVCAEGTGCSV